LYGHGNNALAGLTTNTATGSLTVGAGYVLTSSGAFSNAGVVNIESGAAFSTGTFAYTQSAGTTTVDGTMTAADVSLSGGILTGDGTIIGNLTNAAIVIPGDTAGTLSVHGNYTQTGSGSLDIYISGPGVYSSLVVSGTATLAGALNIFLAPGYTPDVGASFTILSFGTRQGDFGTENGLNLGNGHFFVANDSGDVLTLLLE
jgi:hypothetical protein